MAFVTQSLISEAWQEKWVSTFVTAVPFSKFQKLQRKIKRTRYPPNSTERAKMESIPAQKLRKMTEQSKERKNEIRKERKKKYMSK